MSDDPPHAHDHYRDARYYDHAYSRYKSDVAFYVELATALGGPVLELGGGTGRVTIPIAKAGVSIVSVDLMESMLQQARARIAKLSRAVRDRIELVEGDLRTLDLDRRFALVISPFNVLMHLYTRPDVEAALATVRRHCAPGGRFAFDVLLPDPASLALNPNRFYKSRPITHPRDGARYGYAESFEYDHDAQIQTTVIRFERLEDGEELYDRLMQRQYFPRELEALLHYNGFEVLRHDGAFDGRPIDGLSDSQVVIARPRAQ